MKNKGVPDDLHCDWVSVRVWLISFLRAFLEYSKMPDTKDSWLWFEESVKNLPQIVEGPKLERVSAEHMSYIEEEIINTFYNEAAFHRSGLPGMFNDAIVGARELLPVLEQDLPPEVISKDVQRICDGI